MSSDVIILAAGKSERMKEWKIGLDFYGKKMIEIVIEKFEDICDDTIVVGGYNFERLKEILEGKNVKIVFNERYNESMFISIKKGVFSVKSERFFIIPADCPFIKKETILDMLKQDGDIIVPYYKGKGGHPVLISSKLKNDLLNEDDNSNLKNFINKYGFSIFNTEDLNIIVDLDTYGEYERFKEIYR